MSDSGGVPWIGERLVKCGTEGKLPAARSGAERDEGPDTGKGQHDNGTCNQVEYSNTLDHGLNLQKLSELVH